MKHPFKNAIYSGIGFIVPILIALFTTPYIIHELGIELYGIYVICISIIGFMSFFDLGFGNGIVKFVSQYEAKGDFGRVNKVINTTLVMNIFTGFLGAIFIFFFAEYLAVHLFKIKIENQYIAGLAFKITATGFLIVLLNGIFSNIPRALQRYDIVIKIQTSIWIASTLATVIILYIGFSLKEVLLSWVIFQFLALIAYYYASKPLLSLKIDFNFSIEVFKEIFGFSIFTAMNNITGNIVFRADKIIIGAILGASFVTYYQIPFMIVHIANGFISSLMQFLFPMVSSIHSLDNREKLKNIYKKSIRYITSLTITITAGLILVGNNFIYLWMGQDFAERSAFIMPFISFVFFFVTISVVAFYFYNGLGKSQINMISSLIGTLCYLLATIFLVPKYGLNGAAISFAFILIPCPPYFHILIRLLGEDIRWHMNILFKMAIILIIAVSLKYFVSIPSGIEWFILGSLFSVALCCLMLMILKILKWQDLVELRLNLIKSIK